MSDDTPAKLVIGGPVGAGKTTVVHALADTEPVATEMPLADAGADDAKQTTTVAFDFATIFIDDAPPLFLYGLPGQVHFGFMREIVFKGAIGALVILDATAVSLLEDCRYWLNAVREEGGEELPVVIGITKTEDAEAFDMASVKETVREAGLPVPVFTFDARDPEQAAHLMRALLMSATV